MRARLFPALSRRSLRRVGPASVPTGLLFSALAIVTLPHTIGVSACAIFSGAPATGERVLIKGARCSATRDIFVRDPF